MSSQGLNQGEVTEGWGEGTGGRTYLSTYYVPGCPGHHPSNSAPNFSLCWTPSTV